MDTAAHPPVVRPATEADVPVLVEILSAAFQDDPVFSWVYPDAARRAARNGPTFELIVGSQLPLGQVYAAEGGSGPVAAAVWTPAGLEPDPAGEEEMLAAFLAVAEEYADRAQTIMTLMGEAHPKEDHAYLFVIGALPEHQGAGLGSALLRHVTEQLDRDGTAAYLEATCEDNRRLYRRHGFADIGTIQLPDGPPMFRMWRDPS